MQRDRRRPAYLPPSIVALPIPATALMAWLVGVATVFGAFHLAPIAGAAEEQRQIVIAPPTTDSFAAHVVDASQRFGIPAAWIRAVIRAESGGDPKALSPKGAIGLMQIMPETYAELRMRFELGDDPWNPRDNILAGAAYLRELHDRFGLTGALAAYNAGPGRYEDHLATGRTLPRETLDYVEKLAPAMAQDAVNLASPVGVAPANWRHAPLFARHFGRKATAMPLQLMPQSQDRPRDRNTADLSALVPLRDGLFPARPAEKKP